MKLKAGAGWRVRRTPRVTVAFVSSYACRTAVLILRLSIQGHFFIVTYQDRSRGNGTRIAVRRRYYRIQDRRNSENLEGHMHKVLG